LFFIRLAADQKDSSCVPDGVMRRERHTQVVEDR